MATKNHCELCEKPDEINYRIEQAEQDIKSLKSSKKEIFEKIEENQKETTQKMEENQKETNKKFDKFNTYIIATLTTGIISALLLVANLIIIYGGR